MAVTAIMSCQSKENDRSTPDQGEVSLTAVIDGNEECQRHFAYTPHGSLSLGILNPAAFSQFEPGKKYKLTIEEYQEQGAEESQVVTTAPGE